MPPRSWVERVYNVQRWSRMAKGGHFAAFEQPDLLARDPKKSLAKQNGTAAQAVALYGPSAGLIMKQVLLKS